MINVLPVIHRASPAKILQINVHLVNLIWLSISNQILVLLCAHLEQKYLLNKMVKEHVNFAMKIVQNVLEVLMNALSARPILCSIMISLVKKHAIMFRRLQLMAFANNAKILVKLVWAQLTHAQVVLENIYFMIQLVYNIALKSMSKNQAL